MTAAYVNPFIEASTTVINQTTGLFTALGKVYIKETPYKSDNILVLIGLTGQISGSVVIGFNEGIACRVASAMMGGMPVPELDEIAKSAVGELCNMILGQAAQLFSNMNVQVDITPPTIMTGDNIKLSIHKSVIMCIPLLFDDGAQIEIDLSYVDQK